MIHFSFLYPRALLATAALILALPGLAPAQKLVGHSAASQALTIPNSPALQTNQFSVEYSVYTNSPGNYLPGVSKGTAWQTNIVAGVDSDGKAIGGQSVQFCISGVCKTSTALSLSPVGRWMQVGLTYDGTTATGYADGVAVVTFDGSFFSENSTADIQLGNGTIRDLKIYDAPTTPSLVAHANSNALLGTTAVTVGAASTSSSVILSATGAWTATSNSSFLTVVPSSASGTGNAFIAFTVDAYTGSGSRTGTLTIAGITLTVTQAGPDYTSAAQTSSLLSDPHEYGTELNPTVAVADSSGIVYLQATIPTGDVNNDSIGILDKLDPSTGQVTRLESGLGGPMTVGGDGVVYVLDSASSSIKKWSPSSGQLTTVASNVSGNGIAVDINNNLYIADTNNHQIVQVIAATGQATPIIQGLKYVFGVAVDAALNVYYTETDHASVNVVQDQFIYNGGVNSYYTYKPAGTDNGVIRKWNPSTQALTTVVNANHPYGLAVDGSGNLYFIDKNYYLDDTDGGDGIDNINGTSQWGRNGIPVFNLVRKWTATNGGLTTLAKGGPTQSPLGGFLDASYDFQLSVAGEGNVYFASYAVGIYEVPYAFIPSLTIMKPYGSGSDVLPAVLPATTPLTGLLAPSSDQSWLTVSAGSNGVAHFSFTPQPNTSAPSTAHITMASIQSSVIQTTLVPNVTGLTPAGASTAITGGLLANGTSSNILSTVAAGNVAATSPATGTVVPVGSPVNLLISAGAASLSPTGVQVGSAAGSSSVALSAVVAWTATTNSGFLHVTAGSSSGTGNATVAFTFDAFNATGTRTGTLTIAGLTFTVTQFGTNYITNPDGTFQQVVAVPNVVSQTQASATSAITGVSLTVGTVTTGLSVTIPIGSVISTSPAAGTIVNINSAVNLVISQQGVLVPNVVNQTQAAAISAMNGASLVTGTLTSATSFTVAAGSVISTNPVAGTLIASGTPVSMVISLGSVMPDVIGQPQATATSAITGAGLTVGSVTTTVSLAGLNNPGNLISDTHGNVFIADTGNNAIEEWNATSGQLTTLITGLNQPSAVAIDQAGNLYIADTGNNQIARWDAVSHLVTPLVTGLNHPQGVVVDRIFEGPYSQTGAHQVGSNGDVYFSDTGNNAVGVWTAANNMVTTVLSSGLSQPTGLGWCIGGGLLIADTGNSVIKSSSGAVLVASGLNHPTAVVCDSYQDNNTAFLNYPGYPATDFIPFGDYYIADTGNNAIKFSAAPLHTTLSTLAAGGLNQPLGVASDGLDTVWVADTGLNRLQKLKCNLTTYCGLNGPRTTSTLFRSVPAGAVVSTNPAAGTSINVGASVNVTIEGGTAALSSTSILVGSAGGSSSVFLAIGAAQGTWSATANDAFLHLSVGNGSGTGSAWLAFSIDPFSGTGIRTGTLTIAGLTFTVTQVGTDYVATTQLNTPISGAFNQPDGVAVDGAGNVYIADTINNVVKKWSVATQQVSTLIAGGLTGPHGIAVDGDGNLYVGDNTSIKLWSARIQQLSTLLSSLTTPSGLALDTSGNLYFSSDGQTPAISLWTASTGLVTSPVPSGLNTPRGVAVDLSGNVYFADTGNNAIKEWNSATQVTPLVTTGLSRPFGIAVDSITQDVYFGDAQNSAIKKYNASANPQVSVLVQGTPKGTTNRYRGVAVDPSGNLYFAQTDGNVIGQLSKAYVAPGSLNEPMTAGTGALPPVIPITTTFAPVSDQPWLTIGTVANGVVNFSFTANDTGSSRIGYITILGMQFTVTQAFPMPNVVGQTQAAATATITTAGLAPGNITTAPSGTVAAGSVISSRPAAGAQVNSGSGVDLVVSTGPPVVPPTVVSYSVICGASCVYGLTGTARVHLPWQITGIQVVFSQIVTSANINSLTGVTATGFSGLGTNTLTWTFAGIANSHGSLTTALAGTGPNAIQSAGGTLAGSNTSEALKILEGDFNDDGVVNASDLTLVNNATKAAYNILADINGDGVVSIVDVTATRTQIGQTNP